MKKVFSTVLTVTALATLCVACDKIKPPQPQLQKPPVATSPAKLPTEHEAFTKSAQKELEAVNTVLSDLKAKASSANSQTQAKLNEEILAIEAELGEAQKRLTALGSATADTWLQLKESFGQSLGKLNLDIKNFYQNYI